MKIKNLFFVEYPATLIYSEMTKDSAGINFVSSQGNNNGVVSKVKMIPGIKVYPAGVITVPLKGTVLAAYVQTEQCYVAHQIAVLSPMNPMSLQEKLFYCTCIRNNAYRFSYGRQADKTLEEMELPNDVPGWVCSSQIKPLKTRNETPTVHIEYDDTWCEYPLGKLFEIQKGKRLTKQDMEEGNDNYLGAIDNNNGVRQKINADYLWKPNCITINYNGSVGETFYQSEPFWASDDVNVLYAKGWELNKYIGLFIATVIKAERPKYNYGRKWKKDIMEKSVIKLPSKNGKPDWELMENYIKNLPYGDRI